MLGNVKLKMGLVLITICLLYSGCTNVGEKKHNDAISEYIEQSSDDGDVITLPDGTIVYPDGTMLLAEGSYSNGLEDPFGDQLVQNGDTLVVKDDKIAGTVTLQQNIPGEQIEYSLIILVDYVQQIFFVNEHQYLDYSFELTEADMVEIVFELPLPENVSIFTYLIVYKPNLDELTFESEGRKDFLSTSLFFSTNCYLKDYEYREDEYVFSDDFILLDVNPSGGPFLTKTLQELIPMPSCIGGDDAVKFVFGNATSSETTYAMIAFENWVQVPIYGDDYKLVKFDANKTYYLELVMPDVEDITPYQVFLIPNPFNHTMYEMGSSTLRTIIQPIGVTNMILQYERRNSYEKI